MKKLILCQKSIIRFWENVQMSEDCWEWTGHLWPTGYGRFRLNGGPVLAHRLSWTIYYGDIPEGIFVCHKCDNRKCVRPDHLFLGTSLDNLRDSARKGRQAKNPFTSGIVSPKGVDEIRNKYASGGYLQKELVIEYQISPAAMSALLNYRTYKQ